MEENEFAVGEPLGTVEGYVIDRPMRTRDALEPLLRVLDMTAAERGGVVHLIGVQAPATALTLDALAITEDTAGPTRTRVLETPPGTARVRHIDEGADYQTGAATVRGEGAVAGGSVDVDLPAVCGHGLARALAERLVRGDGLDRLTVALGPQEALALEPGDSLNVEGQAGVWQVERLALDETATAVLARRDAGLRVEPEDVRWRAVDGVQAGGAPFVQILDLPPLRGAEGDDRLIAIAAVEPWRPMAVHVGETVDTLNVRGTVGTHATVGRLTAPLAPGAPHRWDEVNVVTVRLEGQPPTSNSEGAVLGGANLAAVQSATGWEVLQYREAVLLGDGRWRLSGLLRGQQGTEQEMASGAVTGAVVVLLDVAAGRFETAAAERGLMRTARIGPVGQPPGGTGFSETVFEVRRLYGRPWSPAALKAQAVGGDVQVSWTPRARTGGDVWDLEPEETDPRRFRVRLLDGEVERRALEVDTLSITVTADHLAEDFPSGFGADAVVAVSQYGVAFGWGVEARTALIA